MFELFKKYNLIAKVFLFAVIAVCIFGFSELEVKADYYDFEYTYGTFDTGMDKTLMYYQVEEIKYWTKDGEHILIFDVPVFVVPYLQMDAKQLELHVFSKSLFRYDEYLDFEYFFTGYGESASNTNGVYVKKFSCDPTNYYLPYMDYNEAATDAQLTDYSNIFAQAVGALNLDLVNEEQEKVYSADFNLLGVDYKYYLASRIVFRDYKTDYEYRFDRPVYIMAYNQVNATQLELHVYSKQKFKYQVLINDEFEGEYITSDDDGDGVHRLKIVCEPLRAYCLDFMKNQAANDDVLNALSDEFVAFFLSSDFKELVSPDYYEAVTVDYAWVADFKASVKDGKITFSWGDFAGTDSATLNSYINTYVYLLGNFIDSNDSDNSRLWTHYDTEEIYVKFSQHEYEIDLYDWGVTGEYDSAQVILVPYWYFNDETVNPLYRGRVSMANIDIDSGVTDEPLIRDPDTIYDPSNPDYSNWNALTNFTSTYFTKLDNSLNKAINSYDASHMNSTNSVLNGALTQLNTAEDNVIQVTGESLNSFDFNNYLNFGDAVVGGLSAASGLINLFLAESGDFNLLFIVSCVLVFLFVIIGIWRFQ